MSDSSDIVVEVIVWNGEYSLYNPFGHVTTKITKNGIVYSYSLEAKKKPQDVCNTESFTLLDRHEQGNRNGIGFILNLTNEQAKEIFISMQTRFHDYKSKSCIYHTLSHNCTYAIQMSMKKAGIDLYYLFGNKDRLPAHVEESLLKTKNNNGCLVKNIVCYKKGYSQGEIVNKKVAHLLFGINAIHTEDGWLTIDMINQEELGNWNPVS